MRKNLRRLVLLIGFVLLVIAAFIMLKQTFGRRTAVHSTAPEAVSMQPLYQNS